MGAIHSPTHRLARTRRLLDRQQRALRAPEVDLALLADDGRVPAAPPLLPRVPADRPVPGLANRRRPGFRLATEDLPARLDGDQAPDPFHVEAFLVDQPPHLLDPEDLAVGEQAVVALLGPERLEQSLFLVPRIVDDVTPESAAAILIV